MNQQTRSKLEKGLFYTSDLALSSALLAEGHNLCDLDFSDTRKTCFVFVEDQELRDAIKNYWDGRMRVDPRAYFNTLKDLKSRIYNQKYV